MSRTPAGCGCTSMRGYDLATADGPDVRLRTLRIANERGVDGRRDVAGAAPAGGLARGPGDLRALVASAAFEFGARG